MAYDLDSFEKYTRPLTLPDGSVRLITMTGWYWNVMDWLNAETEWPAEWFIKNAFGTSKKMERNGTMKYPGDFHAEFTETLTHYLWLRAEIIDYREHGIANDPDFRAR